MSEQKYAVIVEDLEKPNSSDFISWGEDSLEPSLFDLESAIDAIDGSMMGLKSAGMFPYMVRYEVVPITESNIGNPVYFFEKKGHIVRKGQLL